jgi:hypothetical protein
MTSFDLSSTGLLFPLGLVLVGVLGVLLIAFAIFSAIMFWHWKAYSTGKFTTMATMFTYLVVSGGFIVAMALAVTWYALT